MLTLVKWMRIKTFLPDLMKRISWSIENCTGQKQSFTEKQENQNIVMLKEIKMFLERKHLFRYTSYLLLKNNALALSET